MICSRFSPNTRRANAAPLAVLVFLALWLTGAAPPKLPRAEPHEVGFDAARLSVIDTIVADGLRNRNMPGAVVLVARHGKVAYFKAFGNRQLQPSEVPMTTDTVFDLASITKPMATATGVLKLIEDGRVDLYAPVAKYIPEFAQNGKESITVHQLLTHQSGLIADNALKDYQDGPQTAFERIHALKLTAPPQTRFIYSDVNYIVLGELVQRVSGKTVHELTQEHIFQPLGLTETGYLPREELRLRAAPTEQRDGRWMQGEVHDPRAFLLGGIAGHAGLFSTAEDMAVYAQMLLGDGAYHDVRVMQPATVALMTRSQPVPGGNHRGLGWDMRTGYSINRGDRLSPRVFGHGGFTGTVLWIDPELDLFYIFLSNRVHPDGKGLVNPLAGRIGSAVAAAVMDAPTVRSVRRPTREGNVLTGLDVLERDQFQPLRGRRVGLISNHTGVSRSGKTAVQLLHEAEQVELKALFSPEHGFEGRLDVAKIADARDEATGLRIFSLYGERRSPTTESLDGLDTLVFDIQDIGCRFYTYPSTMGNAMKAAARHGLRFVVLDRPNPINGIDVEGPVLDDGGQSFVGYHTTAVRHGLTLGELATLFNTEMNLGCDLHIVRCDGWNREDYYDRTGLVWINPSPNMRSLTAAVLYPGIGLLETTNLSVGRGTDRPFELLGAPWCDGVKLAQALNAASLPGVRFVPARFTPESSKFAKQECGGVHIVVTHRDELRPVFTGLKIAETLRKLHRDAWDAAAFNRLLIDKSTYDSILDGKSAEDCQSSWQAELSEFRTRRQRALMY